MSPTEPVLGQPTGRQLLEPVEEGPTFEELQQQSSAWNGQQGLPAGYEDLAGTADLSGLGRRRHRRFRM